MNFQKCDCWFPDTDEILCNTLIPAIVWLSGFLYGQITAIHNTDSRVGEKKGKIKYEKLENTRTQSQKYLFVIQIKFHFSRGLRESSLVSPCQQTSYSQSLIHPGRDNSYTYASLHGPTTK